MAMPSASLSAVLQGIREAPRDIIAHDKPIHDHIDVVFEFLVEGRGVGNLVEGAVDLDPLKALFFMSSASSLRYSPLRPAHHRGQQIEPCPVFQVENPVNHLADRLTFNRQSGGR